MTNTRKTIQRVLVAALVAGSTGTAWSGTPVEDYKLEIARQPLKQALSQFSDQTQMGVSLLTDEVDQANVVVGPISGRYLVEHALREIIAGTGFTFTRVNATTLAVTRSKASFRLASLNGGERFQRVAVATEAADRSTGAAAGTRQESRRKSVRGDVEEVVVTAQRREERARDVPISISVVSGQALDSAPFVGVNDALKRVAGVTSYETQQGGMTKFNIRGVASNSSLFNGSSTVGYYLDEIPFGFVKFPVSPDANAYDLDRLEVLRGPQGTLYGANALNGVIRIMTRDADLQKFEVKARATVSTTEGGGDNHREDLAVNVPLIEDKLGVRAVVGYGDYSGWIDQPIAGRSNVNDAEQKNGRIKLTARPIDDLKIGLLSWFSRDHRGAASVSFDDQTVPTTIPEPIDTDFDAHALSITYDFAGMSVLSSTSYMDFRNEGILNTGGGPGEQLVTDLRAKVASQEIRISSNTEGSWKWSAGGIYRDEKDLLAQALLVGFPGQRIANNFTSESFALFGEITKLLWDGHVELTGGVRYYEDTNEAIDLSYIAPLPGQPLLRTKADFDAVTPRAVINWKPNDDVSVYASYSEGFRSGFPLQGSQVEILPVGFSRSVKPDRLHNYEIGTKGSAFEDRASYDVAVYYLDWQDTVQRLGIQNRFGIVTFLPLNAESASGVGIDLAGNVAVTSDFDLGATVSWNDLTFDSDVVSSGAVLYPKGSRLDESPELTAGVNFAYSLPLSNDYDCSISGAANYISEMITRSRTALVEGDDLLIAQLSVGINAPRWSATVFADNLTDEGGVVRPTVPPQLYNANRLRPRTVGLQFEYRY